MSLSPLEVLNADLSDVYDLYVNCIIYNDNDKDKGQTNKEVEWVTSKNATWH